MVNKLCRICGINEGTFYIFSQNYGIYAKIVYCCTRIIVAQNDGLPDSICESCKEELENSYQFVKKCEATDERLRLSILQNITKKYEPKVEVKLEVDIEVNENEDLSDIYSPFPHKIETETDLVTTQTPLQKKRSNRKKRICLDCSICKRKCTSKSALAVHMRMHTGETPFECLSCNKNYKDKGNLKNHIRKHHSGERTRNYICEHCGKGFFSKNDVKIHMRTHTGETPYSCTDCPMKFTQLGALIRHKKTHSGDKPHTCSTCSKSFSTKERLKYHFKVHSDEKNYSCSICNTQFKYQNNLRKHMVIHSAPCSFVCNYCGRTFNQKGNLKLHINRQHSEKSGYCNICSKNVSDIEVHMWRHTGQRPLKCEHCTSSFFEMKTLARHVNYRHKNPDKYKCTFEGCTMTFPAKTMLEFHTAKLHETCIPFPCDRCTRGFYRKNDLARHKIGTHKERLIH